MQTSLARRYREVFVEETTHMGIHLKQIGGWQDITAYYAGSDGNAWSAGKYGFINQGDLATFRKIFNTRFRGELL